VGLSAAIALRAAGVDVTVLEAEPEERVRPGSRAIYVHGATLKLLERMSPGLGKRLASRGIVWPTRRTLWRGREVFARTYAPPSRGELPHFTSLPQTVVEELLLDACRRAEVEIVWGTPVTGVASSADGVRLASESRAWDAAYVVGADGARSAVRRGIGVELEGSRSVNSYVIVDVAEDSSDPRPVERVFHYEHPAVGGRNVLLVPFSGGWRADLQCDADDDPSRFSNEEGVRKWIGASLGKKYAERITWVSTYQFLQVIATRFSDAHRRVLLVGEAAHLFAPFGARGMNSGIADAESAARVIAAALHAPDGADGAIDGFAKERHDAAEWNRAAAAEALAHLRGQTPWRRLQRVAAVLSAPYSARIAHWLDAAPYGPSGGPPSTRTKY
jgi:3-(3-hydroxy-phenyl)propionate hydroxylase